MNKIKRTIIGLVLCASALITFTGCKTVNGTKVADTERIARVTREAAMIGTMELLRLHPEWKEHFRIAHAELVALEKSDTVSINNVLDIINRLPVKELKGDNVRLSVTGARLLISAIDIPELDAERLAQVRPIVTALREGLELGGVP